MQKTALEMNMKSNFKINHLKKDVYAKCDSVKQFPTLKTVFNVFLMCLKDSTIILLDSKGVRMPLNER